MKSSSRRLNPSSFVQDSGVKNSERRIVTSQMPAGRKKKTLNFQKNKITNPTTVVQNSENDNDFKLDLQTMVKGKGKGTSQPSSLPSTQPSSHPSVSPSRHPSSSPSYAPSSSPSSLPSTSPSECIDEPGWVVGGDGLYAGMNCTDISGNIDGWCSLIQNEAHATYKGKSIGEACCECSGGKHQTVMPSTTPSHTPSVSQSPSFPVVPSAAPSQCVDEPNWHITTHEGENVNCIWFGKNDHLCVQFEDIVYEEKTVYLACCVCGGGDHQSVAPSTTPTSEPSSEPSTRPSESSSPSSQPSVLPSDSPSEFPSIIPSDSPTESMEPSQIPSMSFGATFDGEPCNYPRECKERSLFPTELECKMRKRRIGHMLSTKKSISTKKSNSKKRTLRSKKSKSPSSLPSYDPSPSPTSEPSLNPSSQPSTGPSRQPTTTPSSSPSSDPSSLPSGSPSSNPSGSPSKTPSSSPSSSPSRSPSTSPSDSPSELPSATPTLSINPSSEPSREPSSDPSYLPSLSLEPSMSPTMQRENGTCIANICKAEVSPAFFYFISPLLTTISIVILKVLSTISTNKIIFFRTL